MYNVTIIFEPSHKHVLFFILLWTCLSDKHLIYFSEYLKLQMIIIVTFVWITQLEISTKFLRIVFVSLLDSQHT